MHVPRLPDWLVYASIVLALVVGAVGRQERADAPQAPPPVPGEDATPLSPFLPFDPGRILSVREDVEPLSGTAFSIADGGVWLTAGHVVQGCRQAALLVADGRGVSARVRLTAGSDVAVLLTDGGAPALPLADQSLKRGERGFHPGFPQGRAGEVTSRLLGRDTLHRGRGRQSAAQTVEAWAESGRTDGLDGMLSGLSGAPVLDGSGQVVGVTLAEAPRRGRLYAAPMSAVRRAMEQAGVAPAGFARGEPVNTENYGRVADGLRRDLRVARVVCVAT